MKLKNLILAALVLCTGTFAIAEEPAKQESAYDAELAERLGADERGMKKYVLAILKTGPKDGDVTGDERQTIFAGHFSNMERLANEGKLAVAGPFGKNDKSFRGLFILNAATVEEAEALASSDPAIKAGIFVVDLIPWYGSASLMASPEIHRKISKPEE